MPPGWDANDSSDSQPSQCPEVGEARPPTKYPRWGNDFLEVHHVKFGDECGGAALAAGTAGSGESGEGDSEGPV